MNVYVVSNDRRLLEALRLSGDYGSVASVSKDMVSILSIEGTAFPSAYHPEVLLLPGDAWIVSDGLLDLYEVFALRSRYPSNRIIYLLSNELDPQTMRTTQSLCAAQGIDYVSPYHTPEQVAEQAGRICLAKESPTSKVIASIGALPQLGVTSSLLAIGSSLAALSGVRVGIFGLNGWNPGDSGLAYTGKYVDELWGSLQGKQLQATELPNKMQLLAPNVYYMAGNRDLKKLYYYQTDGVSWLIEKARECFDLILLDAGSYPDHALAAQSIYASDLLLVHMNQSQQAKIQWRRMCDHILQPVFQWEQRQSMLLFNKMYHSPDVENEKQLSRQLGMPYVGSFPYVPTFYRGEAEGGWANPQSQEYNKELQKVSKAILHYYNLPVTSVTLMEEARVSESGTGSFRGSWLRWMKPAVKEA
ncbi:hypothetical protein [Paenibacillus agricola]|uniref:Uncharacterized protein n=1 Tax=Paenibacillus agricola TaxID=2716264 RepID=A0ABX0JCJ9_9BACL|nr:hypothetical protein [Paenibacillus agricola]NHN33100.1 hypothetical protein [Paenibacillus agricola]